MEEGAEPVFLELAVVEVREPPERMVAGKEACASLASWVLRDLNDDVSATETEHATEMHSQNIGGVCTIRGASIFGTFHGTSGDLSFSESISISTPTSCSASGCVLVNDGAGPPLRAG